MDCVNYQFMDIDPFKHVPKLAEISIFKAVKKRSLLDEILKKSRGNYLFYKYTFNINLISN